LPAKLGAEQNADFADDTDNPCSNPRYSRDPRFSLFWLRLKSSAVSSAVSFSA